MTGQGGLRIQLLGELAILRHGAGTIPLPASRKTRALLGYLAATGQPHRREHLCDLLWDGPDDPRAELRWSLSKIRAALGAGASGVLRTDREHVAFEPGTAEVDLTVLRQRLAGGVSAASTQALQAAVELFHGEFLDGLELPGCYRFHEWCLTEREAVSALRLAALGKLVDRLSNDAPEEALAQARAFIGADPLSEAGHAAVVGLLGRLGRRRDALEHHDRARRLLEAELVAPLTGELESARRTLGPAAAIAVARGPLARPAEQPTRLRMGATDPTVPSRGVLPFVGREAERAVLAELVSAVGAGQVCRVLLVEGEPGIGKSRLLADLADRVTCAGGRALGARSFEAEAAVRAYGIWIDFLRAVPDEEVPEDLRMSLATLRPGLGHAPSGPGDRTRLFDAVADLLRRMAARCPTVLILDDVQWIDEASAALLHYLVRAVGPASPLIFACAARSGELEDNVAAARVARTLGREGRLLMLPLGPLGLEQTAELVRTADPALDAPTVAAESEGNPLLALELARARGGQGWGDAASATLDAIVAGRLARLTDRARELLVWAAALGRGIDPGLLGRVSELHSLGLASVLEEWERRGLVRPAPAGRGGEGYDFTHDLIRQAVYRSASQPRRRLVHGHIARVLRTAIEDDDALAGDLVRHAELSGDHALAAHACRAAGDRCLRLFAVTEAAGLAERGLLHLDRLANAAQSSVARIDLLRIRVRAAQGPGRRRLPDITPAVVDATVAAEAAGLAAAAAMGHHLLSVLHHDAGNDESARDSTLRAAVAGQAVADVTARARRLANTARCLVDLELEVGRARRLMAEAEALARAQGIELCELYWGRGLLERWDGALDSAVPPIERALALARARQDRWREYQCLTWLAITLLEQGRWAETRIRCAELSEVASKLGAEEGPMADVLDALALLGIGDAMPQADEQLRVAVARLRAVDHKAHLAYALNAVAELHLRTGRTEEARACAEEALATATAVRRDGEVAVARATLLRLGYAGEPREVKAEVEHLLAAAAAPDRLGARARIAIRDAAARAKSDVVPTLAPTAGA